MRQAKINFPVLRKVWFYTYSFCHIDVGGVQASSRLRAIFWAVPAFILVEPVITSGPVRISITMLAAFSSAEFCVLTRAIVLQPSCLA